MANLSLAGRSVADHLGSYIWVCIPFSDSIEIMGVLFFFVFFFRMWDCVLGFLDGGSEHVWLMLRWFCSGINVQSGEEVAIKLVCFRSLSFSGWELIA